jgi:hypothetical protein
LAQDVIAFCRFVDRIGHPVDAEVTGADAAPIRRRRTRLIEPNRQFVLPLACPEQGSARAVVTGFSAKGLSVLLQGCE